MYYFYFCCTWLVLFIIHHQKHMKCHVMQTGSYNQHICFCFWTIRFLGICEESFMIFLILHLSKLFIKFHTYLSERALFQPRITKTYYSLIISLFTAYDRWPTIERHRHQQLNIADGRWSSVADRRAMSVWSRIPLDSPENAVHTTVLLWVFFIFYLSRSQTYSSVSQN